MSEENQGDGFEVEADVSIENDAVESDVENSDAKSNDQDEPADDGDLSDNIDKELKTVRKALDKRNRYINNQRQRIRDLEAKMREMESSFGKNKSEAPNMEKFDSVLDYMKADQNYTLEQKLNEQNQKQQLDALKQQKDLALAEQARVIEQQANELSQSNPDFKKVISENRHVFGAMPDHINEIMTELDDGLAAAYALAKEGRLASIYSMPPQLAAAHLVQAEIRGQQYLQQAAQPVKQAPKPIGPLKGSGKPSTKSLDQMTPEEHMKWLHS